MSTLGTLIGRSGFRTEPFRVKGPTGGVIQQIFSKSHYFDATPTAGDSAAFTVPFDCKLVAASMTVATNGTANSTVIKAWDGTIAAGTEMLAGGLAVAHDDDTMTDLTDLTDSTFVERSLDAGDVVTIEVDAIATGVVDVTVDLWFITR